MAATPVNFEAKRAALIAAIDAIIDVRGHWTCNELAAQAGDLRKASDAFAAFMADAIDAVDQRTPRGAENGDNYRNAVSDAAGDYIQTPCAIVEAFADFDIAAE